MEILALSSDDNWKWLKDIVRSIEFSRLARIQADRTGRIISNLSKEETDKIREQVNHEQIPRLHILPGTRIAWFEFKKHSDAIELHGTDASGDKLVTLLIMFIQAPCTTMFGNDASWNAG